MGEVKAPKPRTNKAKEGDFILDINKIREHDPKVKRIIIKVR